MDGLAVNTQDLHAAAGTLASVRGELGCGSVQGGGTGGGALDGALAALAARLDFVAAAMDGALAATSHNLNAGAETYAATDNSQFQGR